MNQNHQLDTTLDTFGLTAAAAAFAHAVALDTALCVLSDSLTPDAAPETSPTALHAGPENVKTAARAFFLTRALMYSRDDFGDTPALAINLALAGFTGADAYSIGAINEAIYGSLSALYDEVPDTDKTAAPVLSRADYAEGILAAAGSRIVGIDFTKLNGDPRTVNGSVKEFDGGNVIVTEHNLSRRAKHPEYRTAVLNRINVIRVNGEAHDLDLIFGQVA